MSSEVAWHKFFGPDAQKYPTPADVPGGVTIPPGHTEQLPDWLSWGKAWKAYYDTTEPKEREIPADGRPLIPPPGASIDEWRDYGEKMGAWFKTRSGKDISIPVL